MEGIEGRSPDGAIGKPTQQTPFSPISAETRASPLTTPEKPKVSPETSATNKANIITGEKQANEIPDMARTSAINSVMETVANFKSPTEDDKRLAPQNETGTPQIDKESSIPESENQGEKFNEENTNPQQKPKEQVDNAGSKQTQETEQKITMDDIADQFKKLMPDYDFQNDKDYFNEIAKTPKDMEITKNILDFLIENKNSLGNNLKNSELFKGLSIDASKATTAANIAIIENIRMQIAEKREKIKQEKEEDNLLIKLLKTLGVLLEAGKTGMRAAVKEIQRSYPPSL